MGVAVSVALCATSNDVEDPRRPHGSKVSSLAMAMEVDGEQWREGESEWRKERGRVNGVN